MDIKYKKLSELKPYKNNAKKHPKEQVERIAESIRQFGFTQPVIIDKDNIVVAGHGRILGAKKAGMKEVPTVCMDQLTEDQIRAYRLIDNKLNESAWDSTLLDMEINSILHTDMTVFGFEYYKETEEEKYTTKTNVPQYEITGEKPEICDLFDLNKTKELQKHIRCSKLPDEVKQFLKYASYRHIVFDYARIAEYYAHADKETQKLFEESALVIIDFNDAIANGYVKLSKDIALLYGEEYEE